jgi:hypothetical protein
MFFLHRYEMSASIGGRLHAVGRSSFHQFSSVYHFVAPLLYFQRHCIGRELSMDPSVLHTHEANDPAKLDHRDPDACTLLTIPAELLIKILCHLPEAQDLLAMFTVCRYIHDIMDSSPDIWTNIPLDGGQIVTDAFIRRSGPDLPLSLTSYDPAPPEFLYQIVREHMHRARSISICIQPPHDRELVRGLESSSLDFSSLRVLSLTYYDWTAFEAPLVPSITHNLLGGRATSLTVLHLASVNVFGIPQAPLLQDLQLCETHTPMDQIPIILSAAPNVKHLTFIDCIDESEFGDDTATSATANFPQEHTDSSDRAILPNLQRVIIRDSLPVPTAQLLAHLPSPSEYLEIMQRSYTRSAEVWSFSDPATGSIVRRLSQFKQTLPLEIDTPVSIHVEMRRREVPQDDSSDNSEEDDSGEKRLFVGEIISSWCYRSRHSASPPFRS